MPYKKKLAKVEAPTSQELAKKEAMGMMESNQQFREFKLKEKRKEEAANVVIRDRRNRKISL